MFWFWEGRGSFPNEPPDKGTIPIAPAPGRRQATFREPADQLHGADGLAAESPTDFLDSSELGDMLRYEYHPEADAIALCAEDALSLGGVPC
jgi:hypothetical protein